MTGRLDEDLAAFLQVVDGVGGRRAGAVGDERAGRARRDGAVPGLPAGEQVIHDAGALGLGQELRPEPDQAARRNPELHADAAAPVVHHLRHRAAAHPDLGDDDALKLLGDVDDELLDRLHDLAVDLFRHDVRPGHLQLESFAPHHLDEDRELQLAAPEHLHLLGRVGRLNADRHVAEQLTVEPILDLA